MNKKKQSCLKCKHFSLYQLTEYRFKCKAFRMITVDLPSIYVLKDSKMQCLLFEKKLSGSLKQIKKNNIINNKISHKIDTYI